MKVPLSWLTEYVALKASAEELASRLTFSGIEVEGVHHLGEGLDALIVGEIQSVEPHPQADRLVLCRVYDGQATVPVVCGARNFTAGDKAAFAPVGAVLPNGMRIEKRKVRGVESHGMLCAEDELGLSEDHSGILLVDRSVAAGSPLAPVLGLPDTVLELEITWNRPDCLSIIGIARELAALYRLPLRLPSVAFVESATPVTTLAQVTVEWPARCSRYTGRVLRDLRTAPSPVWMQRRLQRCGVRPISNIVDVTNYVMLECGQPLHAFDYDRVAGHRIVVRAAREGESMRTLDGQERRLTPEMLVIADSERAVAVAGVMGGEGSGIGDTTCHVLLESASFHAPSIHRTSTALGLASESSHRFERGVDPELADWASRRASALLLETAGGDVAQGVLDVRMPPAPARVLACRFARVRALLGIAVADEAIVEIFTALGLLIESRDGERCHVRIPSHRLDLELEADLIEEVARMHGLDQVPEAMPRASAGINVDDSRSWATMRCRERLVGLGLREILNYSFMAEKSLDRFGGGPAASRVILPNPVSSDYSVLRSALLPQMIMTLGHNMSRQVADAGFFEIGRVFTRAEDGATREGEHLAIGLMGKIGRTGLDRQRTVEPDEMFRWLKGVTEALWALQSGGPLALLPETRDAMEPGWSMRIESGGRVVGWAGLLTTSIRDEWRIAEPVGVAELDMEALLAGRSRAMRLEPVPAYPAIRHDVALIVEERIRHEDLVAVIRRAGPAELTEVALFDIFRGGSVGDGRKSMAYTLTYRAPDRTLKDEDANRFDEAIRVALRQELGAEIREG